MNKLSRLLLVLACGSILSAPLTSYAGGWLGISLGGITIGGGGASVGGAVTLPFPKHSPKSEEKAPAQSAQMPEQIQWNNHSPLEQGEQQKVLLLGVYSEKHATDKEWTDDFTNRIQKQLAYPFYDCQAIDFTMPPSEELLKALGDYEKADIVILPVIEKWSYHEQKLVLYNPRLIEDIDPQYEGNIALSIYSYNMKTKEYTKTSNSDYVYGPSYDMPSKEGLWRLTLSKLLQNLPYQRVPNTDK